MTRLDREARVAIEALVSRGTSKAAVARLLGVSESTVRYHAGRMSAGAVDGRGGKGFKATRFEDAIASWREAQTDGAMNLATLHEWLVAEHGYDGSLRSVQRFWAHRYPARAIGARRRVEPPPGAQAQADWAHFPDVIVGGEARSLVAFKMVLSHSRKDAIVWSEGKDMLAWLGCHSEAFRRLGGVPATGRPAALDGRAASGPGGPADLPGHRPDGGRELGGGVRQADAAAGDPAGAVRRR